MMKRWPLIRLVRHAEVHNPEGVVYGSLPGFWLSARGREQARATGLELMRISSRAPIAMVASPLDRAQETQGIIREALSRQNLSIKLLDADARLGEAKTFAEGLPRRFAPKAYFERVRAKGMKGESPMQVANRMFAAIVDAAKRGGDGELIVISHQFPIQMARSALYAAYGSGPTALVARVAPWLLARSRCGHASITTLAIQDGEPPRVSYWEPS